MSRLFAGLALALLAILPSRAADAPPAPQEGDYVVHDFAFTSGETLKELRLHYTTLGTPHRDARGRVDNAVLIMHGTGGTGHQFIRPEFSGVLFVPGGLLDAAKYFIILPDGIGHGKSSKPSDGLHAHFPHYDYDDMVKADYLLLTKGLHVRRRPIRRGMPPIPGLRNTPPRSWRRWTPTIFSISSPPRAITTRRRSSGS